MNQITQELPRLNNVQIIQASKEHAQSIVELELENFKDPLSLAFIIQDIETNPFARYYLTIIEGEAMAYIGIRVIDDVAEVLNIAVKKRYQGQGFGTKLIEYTIEKLKDSQVKRMILEVRQSNHLAQHLYEKLGFEYAYTRPKYYKNEDALVYMKEIK